MLASWARPATIRKPAPPNRNGPLTVAPATPPSAASTSLSPPATSASSTTSLTRHSIPTTRAPPTTAPARPSPSSTTPTSTSTSSISSAPSSAFPPILPTSSSMAMTPALTASTIPMAPITTPGEAYLDVEWSGAVAPKATIDLVIGADTALEAGFFLAAEHAVYGNLAPIISVSFGECEADLGSTNQFVEQPFGSRLPPRALPSWSPPATMAPPDATTTNSRIRPERRRRSAASPPRPMTSPSAAPISTTPTTRQPHPLRISPPTGTPPARQHPERFPACAPSPSSPGTTASSASMP